MEFSIYLYVPSSTHSPHKYTNTHTHAYIRDIRTCGIIYIYIYIYTYLTYEHVELYIYRYVCMYVCMYFVGMYILC